MGSVRSVPLDAAVPGPPAPGRESPSETPRWDKSSEGASQLKEWAYGIPRGHCVDGPPDAPCGLRRRPPRARGTRGQWVRGDRRGAAPPRDTASSRHVLLAPLSAGVLAAGRAASDGQRELHVPPGEHETTAGRENGPLLAPCVRHRQLEGGQLRSAAGAEDRKSTRLNSSHGSISYA